MRLLFFLLAGLGSLSILAAESQTENRPKMVGHEIKREYERRKEEIVELTEEEIERRRNNAARYTEQLSPIISENYSFNLSPSETLRKFHYRLNAHIRQVEQYMSAHLLHLAPFSSRVLEIEKKRDQLFDTYFLTFCNSPISEAGHLREHYLLLNNEIQKLAFDLGMAKWEREQRF